MALPTVCSSSCRSSCRLPLLIINLKELKKLKVFPFSTNSGDSDNSNCNNNECKNAKENSQSSTNSHKNGGNSDFPEPPTNCCMSGCANCVYLEYAEQLTKIFKDSGEKSREIILSKISDPNMQAFLRTELQIMAMKAKDDSDKDK